MDLIRRASHSLTRKLFDNTANFATTGGAANAYTATFSPPHILASDFSCYLRIHATNTGASTLDANGTGAKNLMKIQGAAVVALSQGDLVEDGIYQVIRDQVGDRYVVISRIGEVAQKNEANTFTAGLTIDLAALGDALKIPPATAGVTGRINFNDPDRSALRRNYKIDRASGSIRFLTEDDAGGNGVVRFSFTEDGSMDAGIVSLARVGESGNYITGVLAPGAVQTDEIITTSLGVAVNNLQILGMGKNNGEDGAFVGVLVRNNGAFQMFGNVAGDPTGLDFSEPASSSRIRISVKNTGSVSNAISVFYSILRES